MTNTNTKVPFISGPYYKEMLRQLRSIGIIAAIVQAFYGLLGEFSSYYSGNGLAITGSSHRCIYLLYFFVAAILFIRNHISRGYIDVSGSLPLKKRTMFASHFAAVMTYAAIIFAANYVGVAIGEIIRSIGKAGAYTLPDGFFDSAKTMIIYLFAGIGIYGLMVMLSSIVNKAFSYLVALAVLVNLPALFISFASLYSTAPFSLGEIFFPVGTAGRQSLAFAALVVGALIALAAGYFAYANSRAETGNRPARSPWIHIAIGVGLAACVGLLVFTVYRTARLYQTAYDGLSSSPEAVKSAAAALLTAIIVAAVLMVLAYTVYMWITLKSFKKAVGRLVFLPIAALIILLAIPVGKAAEAKWNRVNTKAENIAYVTIPDEAITNGLTSPAYVLTSTVFGNSFNINRGRTGSDKVRFTNPEMISSAAKLLEYKRSDGDTAYFSGIFSLLERLFEGDYYSNIDVTLKDGSTWTVSTAYLNYETEVEPYLMENEEYMARVTGTERFGRAKVMTPYWLDREFADTLLAEINSLPAPERLQIFKNNQKHYYYIEEDGEETDVGAKILIASPTYDHTVYVNLNGKLPKSLALYMKKANEHAAKDRNTAEIIDRLGSGEFDYTSFEIMLIDGKNVHKYSAGITMDQGMEPEYKAYAAKLRKTIADSLKNGSSPEGSRFILGIRFDYFEVITDENDYRYVDLVNSDPVTMFVSIDEATYNELFEDLYGTGEIDPWDGGETYYD